MRHYTLIELKGVLTLKQLAEFKTDLCYGPPPLPIRGIFAGNASVSNIIQYITIQTTGNSSDFGDLVNTAGRLAAYAG